MEARATLALKPGVWFRRGRLLIVSPDSLGTACPLSGRNSTYRLVQILEAGSVCGREATTAAHLIEGLFYPAEPFVDIFQRQLHARRIVSQLHPTDKHENAS
jgi:hypothetical protein